VLRADASGWPFTRDLTWFTASLVVHPALVAGLNGRAIDFAKLGALYLHGGVWRGRQLVPRRWVAGSTRADTRTDPSPWFEYGWWTRPPQRFLGPRQPRPVVHVSPGRNVVLVRFGTDYNYDNRRTCLPGWPAAYERN
jgi:CubicO group peptidase (beta-lactamase class C family)